MKSAVISYERSITTKIKGDPRLVYSYINKKKGIRNGIKSLRLADGTTKSEPEITANEFNHFFESVFSAMDQNQNKVFDKKTFKFAVDK